MDTDSDVVEEQYKFAKERTRLARERTTLAHIRTGFAAFLFGIAIVGIYGEVGHLLGAVFIGIGIIFVLTSGVSYMASKRRTNQILERLDLPLLRE